MTRGNPEDYLLAGVGAAEGIWRYYIRPEITAKRSWLAIGALVVAHEVACPPGQLLSEAADRAIDKRPLITRLAGVCVAAHVINMIPQKYDPIHQALKAVKSTGKIFNCASLF